MITGKSGYIFRDGTGYAIFVSTDELPRRWTNTKKRLAFCNVSQTATTRASWRSIGYRHQKGQHNPGGYRY